MSDPVATRDPAPGFIGPQLTPGGSSLAVHMARHSVLEERAISTSTEQERGAGIKQPERIFVGG
ncbi:hypothetical protein [Lolliginicoccus suaedae]|uniref:hypothetical protein n=1 Tax=Lolliginicoccus suaedae TaxID=2605429 RepID=UPI0011ED5833|nr:hypothetical protein [Lolliginicoccus suaedae]